MSTSKPLSTVVAAKRLSALGSERRLEVFRLLIRAGSSGLNVTEIQRRLDVPMSTLTHHIAALVESDLVSQERLGRELICTANFAAVRVVATFLLEDCCAEAGNLESARAAA